MIFIRKNSKNTKEHENLISLKVIWQEIKGHIWCQVKLITVGLEPACSYLVKYLIWDLREKGLHVVL